MEWPRRMRQDDCEEMTPGRAARLGARVCHGGLVRLVAAVGAVPVVIIAVPVVSNRLQGSLFFRGGNSLQHGHRKDRSGRGRGGEGRRTREDAGDQ